MQGQRVVVERPKLVAVKLVKPPLSLHPLAWLELQVRVWAIKDRVKNESYDTLDTITTNKSPSLIP